MLAAAIAASSNQSGIKLSSLLKACFKANETGVPFVFSDMDGNCNLIYSSELLKTEKIVNSLKRLVSHINEKFSIDVFFSCSPVLLGYTSIPNCYAEARKLLSYSLIFGKNTVISSDYITEHIIKPNQKLNMDHTRIKNGVINSDTQGLISYAGELIGRISDIS